VSKGVSSGTGVYIYVWCWRARLRGKGGVGRQVINNLAGAAPRKLNFSNFYWYFETVVIVLRTSVCDVVAVHSAVCKFVRLFIRLLENLDESACVLCRQGERVLCA
jgi:hypothetical protein